MWDVVGERSVKLTVDEFTINILPMLVYPWPIDAKPFWVEMGLFDQEPSKDPSLPIKWVRQ